MKKELREKVKERSESIELKITNYFAKRLGVDNNKTIDALGKNGKLSFIEKLNLFSEMMFLSKIESSKLNIFSKIYDEIVLQNKLTTYDEYFTKEKSYLSFLFNVYLESEVIFSIEDKFNFVINQLLKDIDLLTTYHIKKPQIYYNENTGIKLPE